MAAEPLFVDTNVLIEATDAARLLHRRCTEILESHGNLVFSAQVIREYLVVATRPAGANGLGLSTSDALENLRSFRDVVRLLPEERPLLPVFLSLLVEAACMGKRIHDAHIVASAIAHGVPRILTLNGRDFAAFAAKVAVIAPAELIPTLG